MVASAFFRRSLLALAFTAGPGTVVLGDHAPSYVLPDRRGVPLFVDGIEVSGAVIEGDWGLYRAGAVAPTIYPGPPAYDPALLAPPPARYFPRTGHRPRSGRYEMTPAGRPRPGPAYTRSWSAGSESAPATVYAPFDPPAVIEADMPTHRPHRKPRRKQSPH